MNKNHPSTVRASRRGLKVSALIAGVAVTATCLVATPGAHAADIPAITAASTGFGHSLAVDADGTIWSWGDRGGYGTLGDGQLSGTVTIPQQVSDRGAIPADVDIEQVLATSGSSLALGDDGEVYGWGSNFAGQLGDTTTVDQLHPVQTVQGAIPLGVKIIEITGFDAATFALGDNGWVYSWGSGNLGSAAATGTQAAPVAIDRGAIPEGVKIVDIAGGGSAGRVVVIGDDGKAYAWGLGAGGALGNGGTANSTVPVAVSQGAIPAGVKLVKAAVFPGGAGGTSLAVGDDGRVYGWGSGNLGQLGTGVSVVTQTTPVQVGLGAIPAGVKIVELEGLEYTAIALGDDGKAYSWGRNNSGQLGDGVTIVDGTANARVLAPVAVAQGEIPSGVRLTDITIDGSSGTAVSALGDDGKVYGWGNNARGQLGDGSAISRNTPVVTAFGADPSNAQPIGIVVSSTDALVEDLPSTLVAEVSPAAAGTLTLSIPSRNLTLGTVPVVNGRAQATFTPTFYGSVGVAAQFTPDKPLQFQPTTTTTEIDIAQSPKPKITTSPSQVWWPGTRGDANNPPVTVTAADGDTPADQLTFTVVANSQSQGFAPVVEITGSGATRTLSIVPEAGETFAAASVVITVSDPDGNSASKQLTFQASPTPLSTTGIYYYGDSDASAVVDAGDGHILVADDDDQIIKLYKQGETAYPIREFTISQANATQIAGIESAVRRGDTIYWVGSYAGTTTATRVMFTTTVTGSGADTMLAFDRTNRSTSGFYTTLRAWDTGNVHGLGASALGIGNSAAFPIAGTEWAPGSTGTAYLGFTRPATIGGASRAVIVPVDNFDPVVRDLAAPVFGAPILLDLGGRGIHDIRKNASDQYVIIAGPPSFRNNFALYTWNGDPASAPVFNRDLPQLANETGGEWNAISPLPDLLRTGDTIELVSDSGTARYYGGTNTQAEANQRVRELRKAFADTFTLGEVPGTEAPKLDLEPTVSAKTLAGKAYLSVTVRNLDDVAASSVSITTPFGSKTFTNVAPGASVTISFNSRAATLPVGQATVTGIGADESAFEGVVSFG